MTIVNAWSSYLIQSRTLYNFLYFWICDVNLFFKPVFLDIEETNKKTE